MDIRIEDNGSIVLLRPLTDDAKAWLEEHTDPDAQWFGGALAVEPRYVEAIRAGALDEGFIVGRTL